MITHVVDEEMKAIDKRDKNKNELHTTLDEELKFTLNSLNVIVGQTGSGKSRAVFREISKLNYVDNNPYHQFVYITDEENDKTFIKYKDMIERKNPATGKIEGIPIVKLKYEQANDYLMKLIKAKNLYERIQKKPKIRREDEKELLLDFLGLSGFETPAVHTIILFDDATDCFKNKKDPLNKLFLRNRHHKFTYFFNIHIFTKDAIPMTIKKNMRSFWYFGGYPKQDFNCIFPFIKSPIDREDLYRIYRKIGKRDVLFLDYTDDGTVFEIIPLGHKEDEQWFMPKYGEEEEEEDDYDDDEEEEYDNAGMRNNASPERIY
jgi:hypothetical protein